MFFKKKRKGRGKRRSNFDKNEATSKKQKNPKKTVNYFGV